MNQGLNRRPLAGKIIIFIFADVLGLFRFLRSLISPIIKYLVTFECTYLVILDHVTGSVKVFVSDLINVIFLTYLFKDEILIEELSARFWIRKVADRLRK